MKRILPDMHETYTQLYTHIVFAVENNRSFISKNREGEIYACMATVIEKGGHRLLIVDGTENHVHLLVKLNPAQAISDMIRETKRQSSYYINHYLSTNVKFHWKHGYSAFTLTRSQVNAVYKYIEKQKEYHTDKTFKEEYLEISTRQDAEEESINSSIFKYKHQ